MGIGVLEIAVLLFVIFIILGPKRIQNMLKSAGRGATDFVDNLGKPKGKEDQPPKELPEPRPRKDTELKR